MVRAGGPMIDTLDPVLPNILYVVLVVGVWVGGRRGGAGAAGRPLLGGVASRATVGFFWIAVRRSLGAHRVRRSHDPQAVIGQVGEARTPLDPIGSIYVAGELWTARSLQPVAVGSRVRVGHRGGPLLG